MPEKRLKLINELKKVSSSYFTNRKTEINYYPSVYAGFDNLRLLFKFGKTELIIDEFLQKAMSRLYKCGKSKYDFSNLFFAAMH